MEEPKLIRIWEELVGLENENYYLDINLEMGNGHICSKIKRNDEYDPYLSTHSFYGKSYQYTSIMLQEYGFNVMLENWDGKTEYVSYKDQWSWNGKCDLCKRQKYCNKPCKKYLERKRKDIELALHRALIRRELDIRKVNNDDGIS